MPYPSYSGPVGTGCSQLLGSSISDRQTRIWDQPDGIIEQIKTTYNFEERAHHGKQISVKF
jgi:hypothetical protein